MKTIKFATLPLFLSFLLISPIFSGSKFPLNSDPFFTNPEKDKVWYTPHLIIHDTEWSGEWNISFVTGKMSMMLNNTCNTMVHIAAGTFIGDDWNFGGGKEEVPSSYRITAMIQGNITALTDGAWLRSGVVIAGLNKENKKFFTEMDFYEGANVLPYSEPGASLPGAPDCVLVHLYQFDVGEPFSTSLDLTSYLEKYWQIKYKVWAVYVLIEAIGGQGGDTFMSLDITEFSVWYESRGKDLSSLDGALIEVILNPVLGVVAFVILLVIGIKFMIKLMRRALV